MNKTEAPTWSQVLKLLESSAPPCHGHRKMSEASIRKSCKSRTFVETAVWGKPACSQATKLYRAASPVTMAEPAWPVAAQLPGREHRERLKSTDSAGSRE